MKQILKAAMVALLLMSCGECQSSQNARGCIYNCVDLIPSQREIDDSRKELVLKCLEACKTVRGAK